MGVATAIRARVRNDIVRLVHRDLDLGELVGTISRQLTKAVPFEGTCLLTLDPATLLPTGELVENGLPPAATTRLIEIELREPDVNKFTALARAPVPAASLSAATGGELDRSLRQREIRGPNGFADELRVVLTGPTGTWGALTLLREAERPDFTPTEVRFVASLAPVLADGVRRATLRAHATTSDDDGPETGFLVVGDDDTVELANDGAARWIDELTTDPTRLPVAIRAVVAQTRRAATAGGALATARVHTRAGRWVMVRGSLVGDRIGVLLEAARPAELAAAIADTHGLTERERAITGLVAHGLSTNEIADRMQLSAYTVQDHLKSIFEKTGTGSRGELVARLFLDHHLPQLAGADPHR
jgi:DNA-binding CsgD family transcriptional regulator